MAQTRNRYTDDDSVIEDGVTKTEVIDTDKTPKTFIAKLAERFNIIKKLIDIVDDCWNAIGRLFFSVTFVRSLLPFIVGPAAVIVQCYEALLGLREAYDAVKNTLTKHRGVKIIFGVLIGMAGLAGVGFAIAYFLSGFGVSVFASAFMPIVFPLLLSTIFTLTLIKNSLILHRHKKEYLHAKKVNKIIKHQKISYFSLMKLEKAYLEKKRQGVKYVRSIIDRVEYEEYLSDLKKRKQLLDDARAFNSAIDKQTQKYHALRDEQLENERNVALKSLEITAALVILTATILMTLAAVTTLSFGIFPLIMLISAVVAGLVLKKFESSNHEKNYQYTTNMRKSIKSKVKQFKYFIRPKKSSTLEIMKKIGNNEVQKAPVVANGIEPKISKPRADIYMFDQVKYVANPTNEQDYFSLKF